MTMTITDLTPFIKRAVPKLYVFLYLGAGGLGSCFGPGFSFVFGLVGLVPGLFGLVLFRVPSHFVWHLNYVQLGVKASHFADPSN